MSLLDRIEKKFGRFYLPNLLMMMLAGQVALFFVTSTGLVDPDDLTLQGGRLLSGEVWRVLTFMVLPMTRHPLWFAFGVYITWLMGSALENQWGEFRFNLFVGTAWFFTILVSLVFQESPLGPIAMTNVWIMGLFTLAFARLFPEVQFLLFFIIPVKVKYLGWLAWAGYGLAFLAGGIVDRALILAALSAWLLFFGGETLAALRNRSRRKAFQRQAAVSKEIPFHTCEICGKNNLTHPHVDFRYHGGKCVCASYLQKGTCDES